MSRLSVPKLEADIGASGQIPYVELSAEGHEKDLLGAKIRQLITLAVAISRYGDVTLHTDAALRHGATKEEVAEALRVVAAVNAGFRGRQLGNEQFAR